MTFGSGAYASYVKEVTTCLGYVDRSVLSVKDEWSLGLLQCYTSRIKLMQVELIGMLFCRMDVDPRRLFAVRNPEKVFEMVR